MSIIPATSRVIGDVASSDVVYVNGGTTAEITGSVASGAVVNLDTSTLGGYSSTAPLSVLKIDHTDNFHGTLNFNGDLVDLGGLTTSGGGTAILDWHLDGDTLSMDTRQGQYIHFDFVDKVQGASHVGIQIAQLGSEFYITEGTLHQPAGATPLYGGVNPQPPPPATPVSVAIHDTTTNADVPDAFSHPYTGPVAGIKTETIDITPHSLNITAKADNLFIKTGGGNDAVALHGGTNVVDAGGGSNFLTASGSGHDTFFLDTRGIPKIPTAAGSVPGAIWNTIQGFTHGDAVTFWGVNAYDHLEWQRGEGAAGHTGITLHTLGANSGTEASLTFAGMKDTAGLTLSYGYSGGSNYLYVKAA